MSVPMMPTGLGWRAKHGTATGGFQTRRLWKVQHGHYYVAVENDALLGGGANTLTMSGISADDHGRSLYGARRVADHARSVE